MRRLPNFYLVWPWGFFILFGIIAAAACLVFLVVSVSPCGNFSDLSFWVNLGVLIITLTFGVFTYISAVVAAHPHVNFGIDETGTQTAGSIIRVPSSVFNSHGIPVIISLCVRITDSSRNLLTEPSDTNVQFRGERFVLGGGSGFRSARIDFPLNQVPDGALLIAELSYNNRFVGVRTLTQTWYWDSKNYKEGRWVYQV